MISQFWGAQAASLQVSAACRDQLIPCNNWDAKFVAGKLPATAGQQPAPPDLPATPVVKSLFLAFHVPILNHLDTFQRYHSPAHHSFQRRQESVDRLFAIDDFNDDR